MKILSYTENYATESLTFVVNELQAVNQSHDLLFIYSNRINPGQNELPNMVQAKFSYNRVFNKIRWLMEQWNLYYWLRNFKFSRKLNLYVKKFHPDIIHCHFGTDFLKVFTNLKPEYRTLPFLISFYGFDVTERLKNKAVLSAYQTTMSGKNVFSIAVSKNLVNNINEQIRPLNPAVLMHSGIDTELYKRQFDGRSSNEFVFLQVASYYPKKGHKYTLAAIRQFLDKNKERNYRFIFAGFGPLKTQIEEQVLDLGLSSHVEIRGPVSPQGMVEIGSKANAFIHMSITTDNGEEEGLPNVLLEAMALELPIVSTRHAGIPEIVTDGKNGILCEEKNISQYVRAFEDITKWDLQKGNREKIVNSFSFQSHMKRLEAIYRQIKNSEAICVE